MRRSTLPLYVFPLCWLAMTSAASEPLKYPAARRTEQIDTYRGVRVADPYRWLEEDVRKSKEVAEWVTAENKLTFAYLQAIPQRESIRKRLTELWNYEKYSVPFQADGRIFYTRNDGLQNQSVLYVQDTLDGKPRLLLDPNTWSKDGTVALTGLEASEDGRYLAYGVAEAGSDWQTWRVLEVASGRVLADEIRWIKYSGATWTKDGKGFFYTRYPEPKTGDQFLGLTFNAMLYYHRVGLPQKEDVLVYQRPDHPDWGFAADVSDDGKYLIISIQKGTASKQRILYKDLSEPYGLPLDLIDNFDHEYRFVGNDGLRFYFKTDYQAPRGRVIGIDLRKPQRQDWKEILPQARETLKSVTLVGNLLVTFYLKDAYTQVTFYTTRGTRVREVKLPGIGTANGFRGGRGDTETFYSFSSFATPPSIYHYNLATGESTLFRQAKVKFDSERYEVKQIFYKSKDDTRVPMFITARKNILLDGLNPILLYGYGGFSIPITPQFQIPWLSWLEMGGVLAVANLRGGSEYGEEWHLAGTRLKKQNVFDDFIAAAEWLIDTHYTRQDRLAIQGRSNGGLLVGACMTQRPDLFGACLPGVGVMDMLRFNKFTAGRYWVDDYGSPDNPDEFKALYAYSPYHALLRNGARKYPATLITTADTDDRVVPGHSFKFAAALQAQQKGSAPVLIRIETRAGHGAGRPTVKIIEEVADNWAFLVKNLHMKLPKTE